MNTRRSLDGWLVLVKESRKERALPEGPWETKEAAESFAQAEVGLPWTVARVRFADGANVYVDSGKGNSYAAPNGEVFTLRQVRVMEGWQF